MHLRLKKTPWMKSDNTFINHFSGVQPPIPILTRSLHGGGDSSACVCLQMSKWLLSVCLCLCLKRGEGAFQGANVDVAGRLRTAYTRTQHHPEPPPPPTPCGMAIIKMIYLTIGPRLRD